MKTIKFEDLNGQEITISPSSLATQQAYRIYINKPIEGVPCIHLNKNQVNILINALQDLLISVDYRNISERNWADVSEQYNIQTNLGTIQK